MTKTEIIRDTASFRALEHEWNDLLRASPCDSLFLRWEWMYTWWVHLAGNRQLHLIIVRLDGLLIAIAPLALCRPRIMRLMPFRVLEFLGSGSVGSDYLSVVIRNGYESNVLAELDRSLSRSGKMMELVRVNRDSQSMGDLSRQLCASGWESTSLTITRCPYISTSGHSWSSYFSSLDPGHQKYFSRKQRKLYKEFDVELKTAVTESERQSALELLIQMHLKRWSGREGSTAFHEPELIRFHEAFSRTSLQRGWLQLNTLLLNGEPAAVIYTFKYNNVIYYYQAAFSVDFEKYSVGMITLALTIEKCFAEGALEFDFLHDDEAYKYLWARETRQLVRLEFYPPDTGGKLSRQVMLAKAAIKHHSDESLNV